jgi:hypothetical protein
MLQNIPKIGEYRRTERLLHGKLTCSIYNDRVYGIWTVADTGHIVLPTSILLVNITCKP